MRSVWVEVSPDLSWPLRLDKVLVDFLGFGSHLHWVLCFLEVLTGHPKFNVLVTELGLQEATERYKTIWKTKETGKNTGLLDNVVLVEYFVDISPLETSLSRYNTSVNHYIQSTDPYQWKHIYGFINIFRLVCWLYVMINALWFYSTFEQITYKLII